MQLWEHYEKCLDAHDWTYNYSDDHGVWRAGEDQKSHLYAVREAVEKIDKDKAASMWNKASPWVNTDGSRNENW